MLTGTLALLHRALRLDARLLTTHLLRFGFAVLMYLCLLNAQLQSLGLTGAPGLKLFSSMLYLNLGLIVLAGIGFFATAITEEKEEETLGLLRMAGLNPLSLLLGKSTSRLIGTLLLLAVQFPFTLLAVTLGGATLVQILAGYVALAAFLALTANMGLFCSVACQRGGTASSLVLILFVLHFLGGNLIRPLAVGLTPLGLNPGLTDGLAEFLDGMATQNQIALILSTGFDGPVCGPPLIANLLIAAGFFLVSWGGFNYYTHPKRQPIARHDVATQIAKGFGLARPRPGRHALMWKEYHFITGGTHFLIVRFFAYGAIVGLVFAAATGFALLPLQDVAEWVVYLMLGLVVMEASSYASRLLHDEWREHTLPMLMMLPVPVHRILGAKLAGCVPALIPGLSWLVISLLVWEQGRWHLINALFLPSYWFGGLIFVLLLTLTLFFSLVVRWGALPLALAVMLAAGFFGSCCFFPIMMVGSSSGGSEPSTQAAFLIIDAIVLVLIAGLQFDIHRRLEIAATQ